MAVAAGKRDGAAKGGTQAPGRRFDDSDGTYGYRRMAAQLARWGVACGEELVRP